MLEEIKMEDKIEDTQENEVVSYPEPVGEFEIEDGVLIKNYWSSSDSAVQTEID